MARTKTPAKPRAPRKPAPTRRTFADPSTSLTATKGGFDTAALYRQVFTKQVPYSEWAGRPRYGAEIDVMRVESAIRAADVGIMWPLGDMGREMIALNPKAQGILGKALVPLAAADWDLTPAEGDGLNPEESKRIAAKIRAMLRGIRGFRQSLLLLAWGFWDGRAALENNLVRRGAETWPVRCEWIVPQRLSFEESRSLIVVDRWGDYGQFLRRGPRLEDIPGKFISFSPAMFGDLQEREGLSPRYLFWLLFDRLGWRHKLKLTESFGFPWRLVSQTIQDTLAGLKLGRLDGGEGGAPGDDDKALDYTAAEAENVVKEGVWIGLPGQELEVEYPPAEISDFFTQGSDQILERLAFLTHHNSATSAGAGEGGPRSGDVVQKGDQNVLLDFRGLLLSEAVQEGLVNVLVELNYGPDALVYSPTFQLRTSPTRDRDKEVDRLLKMAAVLPIGVGVGYEASGFRPPNPGEPAIDVPEPAGPFGSPGGQRPPPAISRDEGSSGDAEGALRDLVEKADEDDQQDAADKEAEGQRLARWFGTGRKVQPRSANGTPEVLVEKGTREGARYTSRWADDLLDAADGGDMSTIYRRITSAGRSLDLEPFTRAIERRIVHSLMLGGLDADYEMSNEAVIEPAEFLRFDLVPEGSTGFSDFVTRPFGEAIKAFLSKKVVTRRTFDRMLASAKKRAFTVAGLARKEMVATAHDELGKALTAGDDLRTFRKSLGDRFDAAGWTPLNPSHVETVFRNGVMGAYSDGRKAQMTQPAVLATRPYWQILGVKDARTRIPHGKSHGKVLPAVDPFFDRAGPPFGHNCRCRTVSRSVADLKRLGLTPTIGAALSGLPDEGWNTDGSLL